MGESFVLRGHSAPVKLGVRLLRNTSSIMKNVIIVLLTLPAIWSTPISSPSGQLRQPLTCQERAERLKPRPAYVYIPHQDRTQVILNLKSPECENVPYMIVQYYFDGAEMKVAPREIALSVDVFCPAGEDLRRCSQASVLLNGETVIPLGELQGTGMAVRDPLTSRYAMIPMEAFIQIGKARKVEVKLGRNSFVLPERHLAALREVALKLEGAI